MFRPLRFIIRPSFLFIPPDDDPYGTKHVPDNLGGLLKDSEEHIWMKTIIREKNCVKRSI